MKRSRGMVVMMVVGVATAGDGDAAAAPGRRQTGGRVRRAREGEREGRAHSHLVAVLQPRGSFWLWQPVVWRVSAGAWDESRRSQGGVKFVLLL